MPVFPTIWCGVSSINLVKLYSGVARPRPTRACVLPSTFQQESYDSITNYTRKQIYYSIASNYGPGVYVFPATFYPGH